MQKLGENFASAAQKGDLKSMQHQLSSLQCEPKDLLEYSRPRSGDRPVHLAARHSQLEVLELLTAAGVDLEVANFDGKRALHEAAISGHFSCLEFLLSSGALVDPLKRADWFVPVYN